MYVYILYKDLYRATETHRTSYVYTYVYIYIERERDREIPACSMCTSLYVDVVAMLALTKLFHHASTSSRALVRSSPWLTGHPSLWHGSDGSHKWEIYSWGQSPQKKK